MKPLSLRLLVLALLLWPASVWAEFTEQESTNVALACGISSDFRLTAEKLAGAVQSAGAADQPTRDALSSAMTSLNAQVRTLSYVCAILYGGAPTADEGAQSTFLAQTRTQQLASAWTEYSRLSSVAVGIPKTRSYVSTARALNTANAGYQSALYYADAALASALGKVPQVDQTLAYFDPYPPACAGCVAFHIVGPHGHYIKWQHKRWRSTFYGLNASDAAVLDYQLGADSNAIRTLYLHWGLLWARHFRIAGLAANVSLDSRDSSTDSFCRALTSVKHLTTMSAVPEAGIPQLYFVIGLNVVKLRTFANYEALHEKYVDSWRNNDEGAWQHLIFPDEPQKTRCPGASE